MNSGRSGFSLPEIMKQPQGATGTQRIGQCIAKITGATNKNYGLENFCDKTVSYGDRCGHHFKTRHG